MTTSSNLLSPPLVEFTPWPKMSRLSKSLMVITEKIDGTNAAIGIMAITPGMEGHPDLDSPAVTIVRPKGETGGIDAKWMVYAQSRRRVISTFDDNYGFAKWVEANAESIVIDLGPGLHFGEWWGNGVQRGYGMGSKNFSLFNALRWGGQEWPGFKTPNMSVVPVVVKRQFDTDVARSALDVLKTSGSLAAPGFMDPEGIVIHVPDVNGRWKMTFDGDKHKSETE